MAGKLIVLEGMDGVGTTTQSKLLTDYLRSCGYRVVSSSEPTSSAIGVEIRKILAEGREKSSSLLACLALCFAADRMQHIDTVIEPGLKQNDFIVLDRYVLSSLVYQGLHLPTTFVKEINQFALKPDLTIVLDVDAKEAFLRLSKRQSTRDYYETPQMLEKIRSRYQHFLQEDPRDKVLVDAYGAVQLVHGHIVNVVRDNFF